MTCPHCGCSDAYGSGDTATCAVCHRFVVPDPDADTPNDAIAAVVRNATRQGGTWVTLRGIVRGVRQEEE